jgi:hypothetical protein
MYIAKDRTGKPEKKKGPEPKFYGDLQKVIDKDSSLGESLC